MFARTSTWSGSAEALQSWADNAASKVKGFVEGLPGNAGAVFLIDRESSTALTLTMWDSRGAAAATDKWTELARDPAGVRTLMQATGGKPGKSARYRDIFAPLGLQDELRTCCGCGTLAGAASACSARPPRRCSRETRRGLCSRLAPHLADALAIRLRHLPATEPAMPRLRVRTRSGRWTLLHASWMNTPASNAVAVILQEAVPAQVAPLIMAAYGLTDRERTISAMVCQGLPTRQIASRLHLTADTVQDHLKSVFVRTSVHSRGELVALILQRDYLARAAAGDPLNPSGAFAAG
jgi:DNA-binding CsgD family transcriptional regulator